MIRDSDIASHQHVPRAPAEGELVGHAEAHLGQANGKGRIVILLPSLNEERAIGSVIDRIPWSQLRRLDYEVRVWVVDGRSTDATLEIAARRGAEIFVQQGVGKGNGMRQAFEHFLSHGGRDREADSRGFVVMLDADGTYPPEMIPGFAAALEEGVDIVMGSRFLGHIEDGAITELNRIGNRLLSRFARLLYGVPVTDVCTGMWGFRTEFLRRFGLAARGFDLEADIFASACRLNARISELPIMYHRRVGQPKLIPLRTGLLIAWRLLISRLQDPNHRESREIPPAIASGKAA